MKVIDFVVSEQDVEQYSIVSGDFNPIHLDVSVAHHHGFPNKIAHGLLTMAKIWSQVSREFLSPQEMPLQYDLAFLAPVLVGAKVTLEVIQKDSEIRIIGKCAGKTVVKGVIILKTIGK